MTTITFTIDGGLIVKVQENLGAEGETPPLTNHKDIADAVDTVYNTPVGGSE